MQRELSLSARPMALKDLDTVLAWRNHPDIRVHMLNQNEIDKLEHLAWFQNASVDTDRILLVIEENGTPIGFVHFTMTPDQKTAEWGFYAAPGQPAGTGKKLGSTALAHAFGIARLNQIHACVLDSNERSLHFHQRLGFKHSATPEQLNDGLIRFTLNRDEWIAEQIS